MRKVIIVGGGAAGMMAAAAAGQAGAQVHLFEKNEKLGKKIFITGKGRCNLTNNCEVEDLLNNVCSNSKFLFSSFYGFTAQDAIAFFEANGTKVKTERGNRVFPVSDHAYDVTQALESAMRKAGVRVHLRSEVKALCQSEDGSVNGVRLLGGDVVTADAVIVCTGGLSYRTTGSTGDGMRFAEELGLKVTECIPSLVPMNAREDYVKELQGLSLKNVSVTIKDGKKKLYDDFGEMLFTHFGVSGPLILTASSYVGKTLKKKELQMSIDLKPALDDEQLEKRVLRDFEENMNKAFKNAITGLFPAKLVPIMIRLSGIDPEKKVNLITKEERQTFTGLIRALPVTLTGLRDYNEAIITKGGVSVREINPSTLEAKNVPGLYFAGEVLDLDAVTGGFNLQIAWSTGRLAGQSAAEEVYTEVER